MFIRTCHDNMDWIPLSNQTGICCTPQLLMIIFLGCFYYFKAFVLRTIFPSAGLDPIAYFDVDQQESTGSSRSVMPGYWSMLKLAKDEPFVLFAVLFVILKVVADFIPIVISHLRAFLAVRVRNLNLGIRRGSSQLMERVLTVLDVKRLWSKLRLSNKTRDLRKGASNARAWASSFASVSLGEPSSSRQA